ncbi:MAG: lipopolysaccharide biosynthesis protein [Sulfuriferula sp.]
MSDTLHSKVRSGLLWSLAQSWGVKFTTLLLYMVLARVLDPHQLGVFAAAMVVLAFVGMFVDQGLSQAIVQRAQITVQLLNTVFLINLGLAILIYAVMWFSSPLIAAYFKITELTNILRVSSLAVLISATCFSQQAMLHRNFRYRWLAISALVATLISGVVGIACALNGLGTWSLVAQMLTLSVVSALMLWTQPQWRFSFDLDFAGVGGLLKFGLNRLGASVLDFANTRYVEIFVAATLGPVALGIYSVGVRIYQALMQALSAAVLDVALSGFSRLADDRPALIAAYYKAVTLTTAVAVPIFCLMAAVAPETIVVFFGDKWAESAEVLRPIALLGALHVIEYYNGTLFNAIGKPQIGLQFLILKTVVTFLALWLLHQSDLVSIVYAYVASQLIVMPLSFYLVRRMVGVSLRTLWMTLWRFLVACVIGIGLISLSRQVELIGQLSMLPRLLVLSLIGSLGYAGFLAFTARAQVRELIVLIQVQRQPG